MPAGLDMLYETSIAIDDSVGMEWLRLKNHHPGHELLMYLTEVKPNPNSRMQSNFAVPEYLFKFDPKRQEEFDKQFEPEGPEEKKRFVVGMYRRSNYFVALRDAVDKIESIDRSGSEIQRV